MAPAAKKFLGLENVNPAERVTEGDIAVVHSERANRGVQRDGPKHLRPDIFAAFDALQVAPGPDACFLPKPSFECFGKHAAI
jgi:hypothetical protein